MRITTAVAAGVLVLTLPASAAGKDGSICERAYGVRMAVVKKHGKRAPGRNICRFGVQSQYNSKWTREARTEERAAYLRALRSLNDAPTLLSGAGPPRVAPAGTMSPRVADGPLASIARCESGGDPGAISSSGAFRGKYQFDYGTWASVGGNGDPAVASEAEQDMRAAILYSRRGSAPWPVCG